MSETFYNIYHTITTKQIYYSHTLNVIILVSSTMFQIYNIISCDSSYMPLYCPRNKIKRKEKKKNNQIKIKYKSLSILWYYWHVVWYHCFGTFFILLYDMWLYDYTILYYNSNPKFKKITGNKNKNEKEKQNKPSLLFLTLTLLICILSVILSI